MAWVVQIVPRLEQGITNSRKTCKFRNQTSLSGTFTGDANGVKNTHTRDTGDFPEPPM